MRLIDADALKEKKKHSYREFFENVVSVADIDWMPTVDAEPVRQGKWVDYGASKDAFMQEHKGRCSLCGHEIWRAFARDMHFCPWCGAKMDKEDQDG